MRDKERISKHAAGPAVTGTHQFAVAPISAGRDPPPQLSNQSGGSRQTGGWWADRWPELYQKDKNWGNGGHRPERVGGEREQLRQNSK